MRQNDIEKIIAYQKCFIGPLVWKCFTNNFELLLSEKEFPTFCTFFMYINVHGHQIFAKCTLNECTKMELDPPLRVHFSRHCDFNQLSDCSIITLFMLIHMKEDSESFSNQAFQNWALRGRVIGSYVPQKWVVQGPKLMCFAILEL